MQFLHFIGDGRKTLSWFCLIYIYIYVQMVLHGLHLYAWSGDWHLLGDVCKLTLFLRKAKVIDTL